MNHVTERDKSRMIDELGDALDDLTTIIDQLADDPPARIKPSMLDAVRRALEKASAAVDRLENQQAS
jgi:hypothetical protein